MEAMLRIGLVLWRVAQLITKYDFEFSMECIEASVRRLTNQLWKLIPMREHEEDWLKQLNTVILEIAGMGEIFFTNPQFL